MKNFGVDALYLAPEYLDSVNSFSTAMVGVAVGVFIMSWNITTFILFSRYFKFLATATHPFVKYCFNNFIIPVAFLVFYCIRAISFDRFKELISSTEIIFLSGGFLCGLILIISISLIYFFGAHRTIVRTMKKAGTHPKLFMSHPAPLFLPAPTPARGLLTVHWYLNSFSSVKKPRDVSHYSRELLDSLFKRHHLAGMLSIFIAFVVLVVLGAFMDNRYFQVPAAASITVFFAILIAVLGAINYFLESWSIPALVVLVITLNILYRYEIIDPRNKAFGLNYDKSIPQPGYSREHLLALCAPDKLEADKANMLKVLENWKKRQSGEGKPVMLIINTSGGGTRSACFTFNMLQKLDSICGGNLMRKTFLINGASGGMLGAAYFRELCLQKELGKNINPADPRYADDIAKDILNATLSSFVTRDLASPAQRFSVGDYRFVKDRAYAFEERLNDNTRGLLDKRLKDYASDEYAARTPLVVFNSVITRDSRKMMISTQPISFLMYPPNDSSRVGRNFDPDAVDFGAMFAGQDPMNLRTLTALRMNATFPFILPNVWLPSSPVIDVMDAGLRDNFGQETTLRMLEVFQDWINENTAGVILIQLRDREPGGWEHPFESGNITELITKPMLLLQNNWHKMQDYTQNDQLSYAEKFLGPNFHKFTFQYVSEHKDGGAALNFHLTRREKIDIAASPARPLNKQGLEKLSLLIRQ